MEAYQGSVVRSFETVKESRGFRLFEKLYQKPRITTGQEPPVFWSIYLILPNFKTMLAVIT
jgi:hypothetical protein